MHLNMSLNDPRCENRISGHSDGHACMHVAMLHMRARAPCLFWARGPQVGAKPPGSLGGTMGHLLRNRRARGALFWPRHGPLQYPNAPFPVLALPETRPQDRAPSKQCCCIEKNSKHARFSAPADCPGALDPSARLGLGSGACQHWQSCPLPAPRALCAHYTWRGFTPFKKHAHASLFLHPRGL